MKRSLLFLLSLTALVCVLGTSCEKEVVLGTVTTAAVTDIGAQTATGGGNVTDNGYGTITAGICWSTIENPTIDGNKSEDLTGEVTGSFTSDITGLAPGVKYYVRAYVTNSAGTAYGNQVEFTASL